MKKIVLLLCAIICANVLMAQQQTAILQHNDSTRVFYGTNSFVEAYNAAASGDVITLSDGVFNACGINKGITLRGNGAMADTARGTHGTIFLTSITVSNIIDSLQFEAEGIYFDELIINHSAANNRLMKCIFGHFYCDNATRSAKITTTMTNCIVENGNIHVNFNSMSTCVNCVVKTTNMPFNTSCLNCIILGRDTHNPHNSYTSNLLSSSMYDNCIIINTDTTIGILNNRPCRNSIICRDTVIANNVSTVSIGNVFMNVQDVFESWDGSAIEYSEDAYRLKDSVATSVLGIDGTQVGIYGGLMPFDLTPSYSIIRRCNVANRTTADGKLSVDIEVVTE